MRFVYIVLVALGLAIGGSTGRRACAQGVTPGTSSAPSIESYRRAAEQGNKVAQNNLGVCYERGTGVEQDLAEAVRWYRKAAEQGDAAAEFNLGRCYASGKGVEKDRNLGVQWLRKAADGGSAEAAKALEKLARADERMWWVNLGLRVLMVLALASLIWKWRKKWKAQRRAPYTLNSAPPTPLTDSGSGAPREFFRGTRCFRSRKVVMLTIAVVMLAAFFWWGLIFPMATGGASKNLSLIAAGVTSVIALAALGRVIAGGSLELVVSTEGVRYADKFWAWNQISLISDVRASFLSVYNLQITLAGSGRVIILMIDKPLSREASSKLLGEIHAWLQTQQPELKLKVLAP